MGWPKGVPHTPEMIAKRVQALKTSGAGRRRSEVVDGVECWQCATCREWLPPTNFYADAGQSSGLKSDCKRCHIRRTVESRNPETHRIRRLESARRERIEQPEKVRERERRASRSRVRDHRNAARRALNAAVRKGAIVRPECCSACGRAGKVTGHHHDYSKPLDVMWLCYQCHADEHRREGKEAR